MSLKKTKKHIETASGIEAVSFCEVERSKRYSRKPGPEGDAQIIKFKFQELWLLFEISPYVEMTILYGYFAWASTPLSLTRLSIKNPF